MKTQTSKVLILLFSLAALHLAEACWMKTDNCECNPFFDYANVAVDVNNPAHDAFLELALLPADLQFLTNATQEHGFEFNTSALACDCAERGERGDKFGFQSFTITAGEDWNSNFPAGKSLNELFFLYRRVGSTVNVIALPEIDFTGFGSWTSKTILKCFEKPQNPEQEFHFLVTIVKTNGETLKVKVPAVKWK